MTTTTSTAARTPVLSARIHDGSIRVRGSEYVGTAADGVMLTIGYVGHEGMAEAYLSDFPTPAHW